MQVSTLSMFLSGSGKFTQVVEKLRRCDDMWWACSTHLITHLITAITRSHQRSQTSTKKNSAAT